MLNNVCQTAKVKNAAMTDAEALAVYANRTKTVSWDIAFMGAGVFGIRGVVTVLMRSGVWTESCIFVIAPWKARTAGGTRIYECIVALNLLGFLTLRGSFRWNVILTVIQIAMAMNAGMMGAVEYAGSAKRGKYV